MSRGPQKRAYFNQGPAGRDFSRLTVDKDDITARDANGVSFTVQNDTSQKIAPTSVILCPEQLQNLMEFLEEKTEGLDNTDPLWEDITRGVMMSGPEC